MANSLESLEYLIVPGTVAAAPGSPYGLFADTNNTLTRGTNSGSYNTPVSTLPQRTAWLEQQDFFYDYYFRIWIKPVGNYDLGGVSSDQIIPISVWNAYPYTPKTLASITKAGYQNDVLLEPGPTPLVFSPLKMLSYTLTVSSDGDPVIDILTTWNFTGEPPQTLEVVGFRAKTWPLSPDWRNPPLDRYEWLTDVMESRSQFEQRTQLRQAPRRSIEATFVATGDDLGKLDALIFAWGSKNFLLPVWYDKTALSSSLMVGTTRVYCDTTDREFLENGFVLIGNSIDTAAAAQVIEVYPDGLLLKRPITRTFDPGTTVWPARQCRIVSPLSQTQHTSTVVEMRVKFEITDQDEIAPIPSATTYAGYQVLTRPHNWLYSIDRDYSRKLNILDNSTGLPKWIDLSNWSQVTRRLKVLLRDRSNRKNFIGWLSSVSGRLTPFWREDIEQLLKMTANQGPGDTALLHIEPIGFPAMLYGMPNRMALALWHKNGTTYYRKILAAATDAATGDELLTLDAAIPASVPSDWQRITYLELMRLDADAIEIAHQSDTVAEVQFAIRGIKQ
jgi:hypothetical protein